MKKLIKKLGRKFLRGKMYRADPIFFTYLALRELLADNKDKKIKNILNYLYKSNQKQIIQIIESIKDVHLKQTIEVHDKIKLLLFNDFEQFYLEKDIRRLHALYNLCYCAGFLSVIPEAYQLLNNLIVELKISKPINLKKIVEDVTEKKSELVCIVGPSVSTFEKNNPDLVVFLGRQKFSLINAPNKIVYVNVENSLKISEKEFQEAVDEKLHYVFKTRKIGHPIQDKFFESKIAREVKSAPSFVIGHPHLFPIAIYELLLEGYKKFEITGVNFYISDVMYSENYHDHYENNIVSSFDIEQRLKRLYIFCHHDLLAQFLFIKEVSKYCEVSGDKAFMSVLSLSAQNYMNKILMLYVLGKDNR